MSNREIDKLKVIQNTIDGRLTWPQSAAILSLSERQIGRLCAKVRREGNRGIIHGLKGRVSNHRLPEGVINKAIRLVKSRYPDFMPTFANEKLLENHKIKISVNTLRKAMIKEGIYRPRKVKPKHRSWRPRRSCVGMLVQLDGSDHNWFENRGPRCVFLTFIDDATSRVLYGRFIPVEDTINLLRCAKEYLKINGRPVAIYVDKDSIYKVNRQASVEEELRDKVPLSQFARAMTELGINMIFADSPQAKGRVERGFKTHQDRLVKELRLAGISDIAQANKFLDEIYMPKYNSRFAVAPASPVNAHRALLKTHNLEGALCIKTVRTLACDYTLRYKNQFLQITAEQEVRIRPGNKVLIEERLDTSLHLMFKGKYLRFKAIDKRPYRGYYAANKSVLRAMEKPSVGTSVPGKDHPWRRFPLKKPVFLQRQILQQSKYKQYPHN